MVLETDLGCHVLNEDEDYVLDVRGFRQIIVHDDGVDASEIISAAVGLVPPVDQFYGSAEVAIHRTDGTGHVETHRPPSVVSAPLISGARYFGTGATEPDPWSDDRDPWTTVQRKKKFVESSTPGITSGPTLATGFPSSSSGPSTAFLPSAPTTSPVATGPIFPAPLLAFATPSTYTPGNTYFTHIKGIHTSEKWKEAKQQVLTSVPVSAGQISEVDRCDDSLESRPIDSESSTLPVVLQACTRRPT